MINTIPMPREARETGENFTLTASGQISWTGDGAEAVATLLAEYLQPATGFKLPVQPGTDGQIHLHAEGPGKPDAAGFVDECYRLRVDAGQVALRAPNATGLARGIQLLRQLLPPAIFSPVPSATAWVLPGVDIEDRPRFRWRGQHLDVSRHFFSVETVCRFIDLLALHRLNILHLHLTDDQGWRLEIKAYPRLTEVGSRRACTQCGPDEDHPRRYNSTPHDGFYSQEDIRAIVAYAARRHIMVIPEIDMPGHMTAAIAAYPELGTTGAAPEVACHWGIFNNILNPEERTIAFMLQVLDETMALFPAPYIHIGGDEAEKHEWRQSRRVQERMAELNIASEAALQTWFMDRMTKHVRAAGRTPISWDESIEGGLTDGMVVMDWLNKGAAAQATAQGHAVVIAANRPLYFNADQAAPLPGERFPTGFMNTTDSVYAFEPVPAEMTPEQAALVLGAQGHLWTEYIPTVAQLEYQAFPRLCALAEALWRERGSGSFPSFRARMARHRERLGVLGVNAHPLDTAGTPEPSA